jgi:heme o synthase
VSTSDPNVLAAAALAANPAWTPETAVGGGRPVGLRWAQLVRLCKPRVVSLVVFTAVIGMFLAVPGVPAARVVLFGSLGIALVAGAAAALNCLIEREIDAKMARTRARPLPTGLVTPRQTLPFAIGLGAVGLLLLHTQVNALTMWLTLATFLGYAVIYTVILKPLTPQNIVIGGLSGAMPPVLGWSAVTGEVSSNALLLLLIIFVWTPPHFWALALYRKQEYAKVGIPMLPVTHGEHFTCVHVLLYTVILTAVSLMPFVCGMSGTVYLASALLLDGVFLRHAFTLYRTFNARLAARTFRYSILYLALLFAALLVDHYLRF